MIARVFTEGSYGDLNDILLTTRQAYNVFWPEQAHSKFILAF